LDWKEVFFENLKRSQNNANEEFFFFYQKTSLEIKDYIMKEMKKKTDHVSLIDEIENLVKKREMIQKSEISKNPLGEILEPGFRVIFPEVDLKKLKDKKNCSLILEDFFNETHSIHPL